MILTDASETIKDYYLLPLWIYSLFFTIYGIALIINFSTAYFVNSIVPNETSTYKPNLLNLFVGINYVLYCSPLILLIVYLVKKVIPN